MKFMIRESVVRRAIFALIIVLFVVGIYGALEPVNEAGSHERVLVSKRNYVATARNLSTLTKNEDGDDNGEGGGGEGTGGAGGGDDNSGGGYGGEGGDGNDNNTGDGSMNRIGAGNTECTKDNILVFQGATSPMPNGIPTYTVEIQNVCLSGSCSISNIHLSCGWFSSARLINPRIFRRIEYDDCLVNDGEAVNPGEALSFQYANTFKYPLSVSSVAC